MKQYIVVTREKDFMHNEVVREVYRGFSLDVASDIMEVYRRYYPDLGVFIRVKWMGDKKVEEHTNEEAF